MSETNNSFDSENNDQQEQNKLKPKKMTVLEKKYFEQAKQKHKQNLGQTQVVQGKTYKGQGFISKPEQIIFKDFQVNEPVVQTIYLTNVSYGFNSFKVMPLNDSIKNYFDIFYTPSGPITAGMSVPLTIRFSPQLNEDIDDCLPLFAQTGQINIPLKCSCQKAIVRLEDNVIDFGKVIFGEQFSKNLKLVNDGALSSQFQIKSEHGFNLKLENSFSQSSKRSGVPEEERLDQEALKGLLEQLMFDRYGSIQGYSRKNVSFTYKPNEIGLFELKLQVYFDNFQYSPQQQLIIKGECVPVPIYIENPTIDFQICLLNHNYREKLVFKNRGQNSMKIQIQQPVETKQFFEFNPLLGYIQGNSHFEIWLKITANKDLLNSCNKYIKGDILQIPFQLIAADQLLPVDFEVIARLSIDSIHLTPNKVDFGQIYQNQASRRTLQFDNVSKLPQELIFYPLPQNIMIEPESIPIKILPNEKFSLNLIYRGKEKKKEESFLICKIVTGDISTREIKIPYSCEVMVCPLNFSHLKIDFQALQIDESTQTNFEVTNTSNDEIMFEFFQPEYDLSGLSVLPMVRRILPKQKIQINIQYDSFFKTLGPFSLTNIHEKKMQNPFYDYDTHKEISKLQKEQKDQQDQQQQETGNNKKDKKDEPKKDNKKLNAQQQKELEEEERKKAEQKKQEEEEEKRRLKELEDKFDIDTELAKIGGKFKQFNKDTNKYSQHYTWLIPCYFKSLHMQTDSNKNVIYIEISTVSVEKILTVNNSLIDFGEIAVGQRKIEELLIKNCGDSVSTLKMDQLPLKCGFNRLNALRSINPGQTISIVLSFEPEDECPFYQKLRVFSETSCVSVALKGNGVKPEVQVEPSVGLLNTGAVFIGEHSEHSMKIVNVSKFQIEFNIKSIRQGMQNRYGGKVFSYIPQQGIIKKNESMVIQVLFKPDRVGESHYDYLVVDVPNQKEEKQLYVYGKCYPRTLYVHKHIQFKELPALASVQSIDESEFDQIRTADEKLVYSEYNNKIVLEFKKTDQSLPAEQQSEDCFSQKIDIGNCRLLDQKSEKNGNYEITMGKTDGNNYFSCDNLKGVVTGGQETVIAFQFKPPQQDDQFAEIEAFQSFGQWIEQKVELKLQGGVVKPGKSETMTLDIILRAYINGLQ